ncbi:ATP synthase subunit C [Anaerobaca lacustris]|uniref:ATP synthase subunit C n=1 Tax=Anaerobaca lacustris TaxID=3044600 RepID=A0AAW6U159_9BACT|nr:ATP synthase subunit C [Sedimentisphaerales bacterium M17dextr]
MDEPARRLKATITQSVVALLTILAIVGTLFCSNAFAQTAHDEPTVQPEVTQEMAGVMKFGLLAAAAAFGLGAIGAGFAISHVGAAAMGAVAEKPQIAGQALIFVALAEGIVVFGFITALMILGKL